MHCKPFKSYLVTKVVIFAFTFLLASGDPGYQNRTDPSPATAFTLYVKLAVLAVNPVPSSAVSYVLSLRGRGVSVGIVLLGSGGEGWLQPLHTANNSLPLLLWTSHGSSRIPQWMERQAAYVITAKYFGRIRQFLEYDTEDALMAEGIVYEAINISRRDFQLHSSVPVIMALERKVRRHWLQNMKGEIRQLFRVLWRRHQSFRGLLIAQRSDGPWRGFVMDPLKRSREHTSYEGNVDKAVALVMTQAARLMRDLGGYNIVFSIDYNNKVVFRLKENIGYTTVYSPKVKLIFMLQKVFNYSIIPHELILEKHHGDEFILHYIADELNEGSLDFCAKHFSLNEDSLNFDILQASCTQSEIMVLFPTPELLPAWSLPFRVFGLSLWLLLVACVVAYALAWRVVANEPLAASAAAALRALSSCGGTPQDRVRSTAQRLMLAGALLASAIVIAAAYQGRLYTLEVNPERYQGFKTLEEIVINGLPLISSEYWILHNVVFTYLNTTGMVIDNDDLYQNFKCNVESVTQILERRKAGEIFAWILSNKEWETLERILNIDGWSILPCRYVQTNAFMHARRNWPWTSLFNSKIHQMLESGLILHWDHEYEEALKLFHNARKHDYNSYFDSKEDIQIMPFRFGLKDVCALFYVLGMGLFLGTAVFVIEIRLG